MGQFPRGPGLLPVPGLKPTARQDQQARTGNDTAHCEDRLEIARMLVPFGTRAVVYAVQAVPLVSLSVHSFNGWCLTIGLTAAEISDRA